MINNIELLAFIKENLAFARTIVIKNENLAIADNLLMKKHYGLDSGSDKKYWRYYLNLNGEYHKTDEMMVIKSLDDNETINFTKSNLEKHPATKKAYRLGGYYFSRLNAAYPGQTELIQGIINPISPDESLKADNFQILRYTKEYVNWNETQLIPALQDDINKNVYQFYNTEYVATDSLMTPALIAVLEKCIFEFLLQNRFENKQTRYAHPFYIWSYLQSQGISPIYKELLNEKQTMWLFRNIDYVLRNLGKEKTFRELIDILLTERDIPLSKFDLVQSTESMKETMQPEPLYYSERLNLIEKKGLGSTLYQIDKIMLKETPESLDNEINYDQFLNNTKETSAFSEQSQYPIKILDSDLVDITNRKQETIYHVLNNELIYLAGKNLYNINIEIEEPSTGNHHRLSIKEAITLWYHLLNKYNGVECKNIHPFYYQKVLKITPPGLSTLLNTGSKPFITEAWCRDVLKTHIPQIRIVSPSLFYENSVAIFNLKWTHEKMYSRWPSIGYYSRRKNAISSLYETGFIKLTNDKTYADFLARFDFDFSEYTKENYFRLMWEIWKKMTGWDQFTHITLAQIQSGMIGLMRFLSSYNVQYIYQTVMEQGWYEGGVNLFTENPMLLDPNTDGQIELEESTDRWIPIHHRLTTDEEEEMHYYEQGDFEKGSISEELTICENIQQNLMLYDHDIDDLNDNVHGAFMVDLGNKCRQYNEAIPDDIEGLIPKGGQRAGEHVISEMIIDVFEGPKNIGPWEAQNLTIVNNGFDNKGIADTIDGYGYSKVIKIEDFTQNNIAMKRYYVGFSPALLGESVIKFDIIAKNTKTSTTNKVRFDYTITSRNTSGSIVYDTPKTLKPNTPFALTSKVKGVPLEGETVVNQQYIVKDADKPYLTITKTDDGFTGTLTKSEWPETLSIMHVLQTKNNNTPELLSHHYYYLPGTLYAEVSYDPLTDPLFDPIFEHNIADPQSLILERITVGNSHDDWEVVSFGIKTDTQGNIPPNTVKTDYIGIVDYLTPDIVVSKFTDHTVDGKAVRTFEWLYGIDNNVTTIPVILTLKNKKGETQIKNVNYTPTIINYGGHGNWTTSPYDTLYLEVSSITDLLLEGLSTELNIKDASNPERSFLGDQEAILTYDGDGQAFIEEDGIYFTNFTVDIIDVPEGVDYWAVKLEANVKTEAGKTLTLYPYGTVTIDHTRYQQYYVAGLSVITSRLFTSSVFSRAMVGIKPYSSRDDAWEFTKVTRYNGDLSHIPDKLFNDSIFTTTIKDQFGNIIIDGLDPEFSYGFAKENYPLPNGCKIWVSIGGIIDGEKFPKTPDDNRVGFSYVAVINYTNKITGRKRQFISAIQLDYSNPTFRLVNKKRPAVISSGTTNSISNRIAPAIAANTSRYEKGPVKVIAFGSEKYKDNAGNIPTVEDTGSDYSTINCKLTIPKGPLTSGNGITIVVVASWRSGSEFVPGYPFDYETIYNTVLYYAPSEIDLGTTRSITEETEKDDKES